MSNENQNEFAVPITTDVPRENSRLLPRFFRTLDNKKFLSGTLDPLTQPGKLTRINGFAGRRDIPNFQFDDSYVVENSTPRTYYQFEPGYVYEDIKTGDVEWFADYIDYMNQLKYFGANISNHSRLNKQESYAWDPYIDWDKITNFREYYWLPDGPEPVKIYGQLEKIESTIKVTVQDNVDNTSFLFSTTGQESNPRLVLYRGLKYTFEINTPNKKFAIKTSPATGTSNYYNIGVSAQNVESGNIEFDVIVETPDLLYYVDENNSDQIGIIDIKDVSEASYLDIETEILNKRYFKSGSGLELINGLKVQFIGNVYPTNYKDNFWYVEGVGSKIKLIKDTDLTIPNVNISGSSLGGFDSGEFDADPFESAAQLVLQKNYIVINRSSRDRNAWSRTNRWFHKSVIETTAIANGTIPAPDQNQRAKRPIIEFNPNIKLHNMGWKAKTDVDFVDTFTTDVFSTIEGSTGYKVDGNNPLLNGNRVLFLADKDPLVYGKIFEVKFIRNANLNRQQITLREVIDTDPQAGESVFVKSGLENSGSAYYFDGTLWYKAQNKTKVNQTPLFDLFDKNLTSYSNQLIYPNTTFLGNELFSYKIGSSVVDSELGFSISYRSINNTGDIEFEFDLQNASYTYQKSDNVIGNIVSNNAFVRIFEDDDTFTYGNGWTKIDRPIDQYATRILQITAATDRIPIDIFENSGSLYDMRIRVYVNDIKRNDLSVETINNTAYIKFGTSLSVGDKVIYKIRTIGSKNLKGYYEIPAHWEKNPLNETLDSFTLGEVIDHVKTIIENNPEFNGVFPGTGNLSKLGPVSQYGRRFLQHSSPMPLAAFSMIDKDANVIKALRWNAREYSRFKKEFLRLAENLSFDGTTSEIVDQILLKLTESYKIDINAFYFSDMAPYGAHTRREYEVVDTRLPYFVIDSIYNPKSITKRSILVYLNQKPLIHGRDYSFRDDDAFIQILVPLTIGDKILIKDYSNSDGCYIPFTPSALGLYPSFIPEIFVDDTYLEPTKVIQGHDGSIVKAYDDYRDELILDLECRIFNSIRIDYDSKIFDINDIIPGNYRRGDFTKAEFNTVILSDFLGWNNKISQDFSVNSFHIETEPFTYNYNRSIAPNGKEALLGFWRGIYKYFYDTDRPHTHPWEMQGFAIKPKWWDSIYGIRPYTNQNKILWDDIEAGFIRDPENPRYEKKYARPGMSVHLPINEEGNLLSPLDSDIAFSFSLINSKGSYVFGDGAPVETAWRRSSEFPFAIIKAMCVLRGSEFIGKMWDRFRIVRNITGQIVYEPTGRHLQTKDLLYPDVKNSNNDFQQTSGLVNIIDEFVGMQKNIKLDYYKEILTNINAKMSYRIGGFTNKDKIKVVLDSRSPNSTGTVFVSDENYKVFYNKSAPVDTIVYSGVLIEKRTDGYAVYGYDNARNYFEIYAPLSSQNDPSFNVGGVSESFVDWTPNKFYTRSQIVKTDDNSYYRAKISHTSSERFTDDLDKWQKIPNLPLVGGRTAIRRRRFEDTITLVPYGTVYADIQSVVDFLLGYQEYLKSVGFSFDNFNKNISSPLDWFTSAKEFMFWTLQGWQAGAVITLSPSATKLEFQAKINASIDNLDEDFFEYSIFKANGQPLKPDQTNIYRSGNGFVIQPATDTLDGIFHVRTNLVYKEHVLLIDNTTVFNDVIYDKVPGYRQGRVKIIGFKTNKWDGGLTSPGFVYDAATINDWQEFVDYNIGDIVLYRNYYYTAMERIPGSDEFDQNKWKKLEQEPESELIPNFDYKVEQFRDFYELEAGNFDQDQQMLARHLIGFQSRQYLEDIINDDAAQFKFYQGFIKEKGTMNSITKLFDARRASMIGGIDIKEEWAFKVGDYGAVDMISEIEFNLNEDKMLFSPQNIVFSLNKEELNDSSIYNIISTDISIKPLGYDGNPFVTKTLDPSVNNYGHFKYRVAGYVKEEDADHILLSHDSLVNYNYELFQDRDIIWIGYTPNNDWNIYQYYNTKIFIQNYTINGQTVKLECNKIPDLTSNDYVVIRNLDSLDGIYKVQAVYNNFVEVFAFNADDIFVSTTDSTAGILYKIESVRHATSATIAPRRYNDAKIHGDKLWIDADSENHWMVLENVDAFTESALGPYLKYDRQRFGFDVKITKDNNWMYVSLVNYDSGKVIAYNRPNRQSDWAFVQTISLPTGYNSISGTEQFGYSLDAVANGSMLVISAPMFSGLKSFYAGDFDPNVNYAPGSIVRDLQDKLWMALVETNNDGSTTIDEFSKDWERVYSYEGRKAGAFTGPTNQGAVFVFEYDYVSLRYEIVSVLGSYNPAINEKFGTKVKLVGTAYDAWLFVSSKNYTNDTGRVQIFRKTTDGSTVGNDGSTLTPTYAWKFNSQVYLDLTYTLGNYGVQYIPTTNSLYGHDIDALPDASRVAVSAPGLGSGTVYIFQQLGETFELIQAVNSVSIATGQTTSLAGSAGTLFDGDMFGYSLAMTAKRLFVGAPQDDNAGTNVGSVFLFDYIGEDSSPNPYRLLQVITPPSIVDNERFGTRVAVNPDENLLAVSAISGATTRQTTFDLHTRRLNEIDPKDYELNPFSDKQTPTTFDVDSTGFFDKIPYTGTVYVYNRFDNYFIYGDALKPINDLSSYDNFGHALAVSSDTIAVGTPEKYLGQFRYGDTFIFKYSDLSWSTKEKQSDLIDINKFKKAFIYNTKEKELTEYLDFVDPAKGRIPGIADQEIKYQTYFDPAVYQYGDETEVSIDLTSPWTNDHIGEVWWDLSKVKFQWYEQGDYTYRNNNWGKLFPGCTIDIYEWVETKYKPSEWARLADTEEGIALGLTGIPRYTDDFTFSLKYDYDPISGTKTALYYYWVKNKKTVPVNSFRNLNTVDISNLIADPRAEGYKYVAITGKNSLSLVNINNRMSEKDIALNLQFYLTDNTEAKIHRQYALIAENDASAIIPSAIENKWFDSLTGSDITGARVPDPKLSLKERYGTENEPRQTWFINRFEALKQLIDYVNSTLAAKSIADEIDFTNLNQKDPEPTLRSCKIDQIVDILDELRFVGTAKIKRGKLSVTVNNGVISAVSIVDKGYGYKTPPTVKIIGTGKGAQIKTYIDKLGQIIDAKVIRTGSGYDTDTTVEVRNFSVLVRIDSEANNGWSVQEWTIEDRIQSNGRVTQRKRWLRAKTQAYDVTKYWTFKDWYLTDSFGNPLYDLSSDIAYEVDYTYELYGLPAVIGDIVKVKNTGNGHWLLLQRISLLNGPDATSDYIVVGKQNGTIELSGKLYNLGKEGYDSIRSFDISQYDSSPAVELRIILKALRDDILIGELRTDYIKAFFNSIHYLMSEQLYIDWVFKTSFLKVNHLLGTLKQRPTFQSDSVASYQAFIEEAKPYKSKIREFVSSYETIEPAATMVSDFDLPSYYDTFSQRIEVTTLDSYNVSQLPWKNWFDNYKHTILEIVLEDGGSGYITAPKVVITGGGGTGAKATAYVASGKVYKVILENGGDGYLTKPEIFFSGGNGDIESKRAKAYAIIGNNKVRTNLIGIKFDRMSPKVDGNILQTDYFVGTGVQTRFKLNYIPYLDKGTFIVTVNNVQSSLAQYTVEDGGYLNFVNAPAVNSQIVVDYYKNIVYRDTFVATANTFTYQLTYAPEIEKNKFKITINGIEMYGEQFSVIVKQSGTELLGFIKFAAAPPTNATIVIEYFKNIRILDAANRIEYAYEPRDGQYGKELGLLMSGVDYGGVEITSIEFDIGGGWDVLGWDVTSWDNVITSNDDYSVISDGSTREFELPYIPQAGEVINIYLNDVRIDDPYYDLYDGSTVYNGRTEPLPGALMNSFEGNGVANVITIPPGVNLVGNLSPDQIYDILTFRKSTSDGSILPTDRSLIDTFINGGNLEYSSALGVNAAEIVIDGDQLVTPDTSYGPEELLQGQVVDALDIKVYNLPSSGGPNFIIRNYVGDGSTNEYPLDSVPGTANSIFIVMNGRFLSYTVDYENNLITLGEVPPLGENLAIMILDTAGYDMIDKVNFTGDGSTTEFLTAATYSINNVTALVLVDGEAKPFELVKSTVADGADNNVLIKFPVAPDNFTLIQVIVFRGTIRKWSQINTQIIPVVSGQLTYTLDPQPQFLEPLSAMAIVVVDDDFLQAPDFEYFEYSTSTYQIQDLRYAINSLTLADVNLYKNGIKLDSATAYSFDATTNTFTINYGFAKAGDIITVEINKYADFTINTNQLVLSTNNYSTINKSYIKVTTFTNHDILKIRTNSNSFEFAVGFDLQTYDTQGYDLTSNAINASGIIDLPREISDTSGLFVSFSRTLLTPNVHYVLLDNKKQLKVLLPQNLKSSDYIQVTTFNPETVKPSFGYKIFKDMLNRYHYKRLDDDASTLLARDFKITDTEMYLVDASKLPLPNPDANFPSAVYVAGERIEYFAKDNNVLSKLRRGTLGTGSKDVIPAGTQVMDVGIAQTVPYADQEIKKVVISDGSTRNIELDYKVNARPGTIDDGSSVYNGWYRETETLTTPAGSFVIGTTYTILSVGTTDFKLIGAASNTIGTKFVATGVGSGNGSASYVVYTSIPPYYGQCDEIEVFVAGRRLRKNPIKIYDAILGANSPKGDKEIEAEYSVDDGATHVRLTTVPEVGQTIVIVKKTGRLWQDLDNPTPLGTSNSNIANFLTVKQVSLPK